MSHLVKVIVLPPAPTPAPRVAALFGPKRARAPRPPSPSSIQVSSSVGGYAYECPPLQHWMSWFVLVMSKQQRAASRRCSSSVAVSAAPFWTFHSRRRAVKNGKCRGPVHSSMFLFVMSSRLQHERQLYKHVLLMSDYFLPQPLNCYEQCACGHDQMVNSISGVMVCHQLLR